MQKNDKEKSRGGLHMNKKFIKLIIVLILTVVILLSQVINAFALSYNNNPNNDNREEKLKDTVIMLIGSPNAYVNGILMNIDISNPSVIPVVEDNRILIPIRFLSEGFGWSVTWDKNTKTVTATLKGRTIEIQLDNKKMFIDGTEYVLDVPARSINGRIFVPLRAFAENALGKSCFYDKGLIIISEKKNTFDSTKDSALLNDLIKELSAKKGNTVGNLVNYGWVVSDGDWIYYTITTNTEKNVGYGIDYLYKAKPDGTQKKLLFSIRGFISDLQIIGNKIYFLSGELNEPDVYRMNTDGTGKTALSRHKTQEDKIWQIIVYGDSIYYIKKIMDYIKLI